jgi:hypothetical protein
MIWLEVLELMIHECKCFLFFSLFNILSALKFRMKVLMLVRHV